ncbi:uncharacterized protein BKA78DRAFT_352311 [Phyllosticta capitalensis]|uniref:uncharacterized protein n=1 Tax=Phyllosticta capitalensis TaxID=121624 RepID=UPI003131C162
MSEDKASGSGKAQGAALSFADVATGIIDDCLSNIIHEIVLSTHREEKLQRMQSAATIAEQAAIQEVHDNAEKTKAANAAQPPSVKIDTPAAVYDNGRVTLRGNPLKTTPEIICPCCKLPRLMFPIAGAGAQMPDLSKNYCTRHPFVSRAGHDIYNNPFPTDMAKTKKERELIKRQEKDNTPGSQDTETAESGGLSKLAAGGKPASYIPWHTCPNCKRSLLITRFAQHAEKCLGIAGRQSSRNAMAKLNNHGTGSANTPLGSRVGTPVPGGSNLGNSSQGGGKVSPVKKSTADDHDNDEEAAAPAVDTTPKKVKKKSSYVKKADREKAAAAAAAAISGGGANDSPKSNTPSSSNLNPNSNKGDGGPQHRSGTKILKLKAPSAAAAAAAAAGSKRPPKDDHKDKEKTKGAKGDKEKDKDSKSHDKERHSTPSSQLLNSNNKREREHHGASSSSKDRTSTSSKNNHGSSKQQHEKRLDSDADVNSGSSDDDDDDDDDDGAPLKKKIRLVKQESAGSGGLGKGGEGGDDKGE